jgi:hypothetical protein
MLLLLPGTTVRPVAPGTLGLVAADDPDWFVVVLAEGEEAAELLAPVP